MDKDCLDPEELPEKMYPKQIILTEDNKLFVSVREPHIMSGDDDIGYEYK
jgi:hypothetical protein